MPQICRPTILMYTAKKKLKLNTISLLRKAKQMHFHKKSFLFILAMFVTLLGFFSYQHLIKRNQLDIMNRIRHTVLIEACKKLQKAMYRRMSPDLLSFGSVCHLPRCIAAYESSVFNNSKHRIPKIRHILWKSDQVSAYFATQLKTWNEIHPDWLYVLWRDSDLEKFVAKHYPDALGKFKSLGANIARIDMVRYMILHHFGGVYADLDYVLVKPLNRFLKFPAVATRETEAHALYYFGMATYPPPLLGNPALMMSEPGHPFFHFCILLLTVKDASDFYNFAGPLGLSDLISQYSKEFPVAQNPDEVLIVPASRSFYSFDGNSLMSSMSSYKEFMIVKLRQQCLSVPESVKELVAYCKDVTNLDPITDRNEPVYAVHDYNKSRSSYDPQGSSTFFDNPVDIRSIVRNVLMADAVF